MDRFIITIVDNEVRFEAPLSFLYRHRAEHSAQLKRIIAALSSCQRAAPYERFFEEPSDSENETLDAILQASQNDTQGFNQPFTMVKGYRFADNAVNRGSFWHDRIGKEVVLTGAPATDPMALVSGYVGEEGGTPFADLKMERFEHVSEPE